MPPPKYRLFHGLFLVLGLCALIAGFLSLGIANDGRVRVPIIFFVLGLIVPLYCFTQILQKTPYKVKTSQAIEFQSAIDKEKKAKLEFFNCPYPDSTERL
jgi:hypothetical protein